jgi:hypothetical protein
MLELTVEAFRGYAIEGVFTDIDDTLTTEGAITADALEALARLRSAGIPVVPITGRPVGWSEPFARAWPVKAIVAENGAVAVLPDGRKIYQQSSLERAANFTRMQAVAARVLREVPGAQLARDSAGRETDIAVDHSEFTHLPQDAIDRVVEIMRTAGMQATVSSIQSTAGMVRTTSSKARDGSCASSSAESSTTKSITGCTSAIRRTTC